MSVQPIIEAMSKLCTMHESLLIISRQKSEYLKEGNVTALQQLLPKENQHVRAIEKLEKNRIQLTNEWFERYAGPETEQTITSMLEYMDDEKERAELKAVYEKLVIILADLKQQEQLNEELTRQSLQFVELSLNMLQPSAKSINYGKGKDSGDSSRSIFDSKA